MDTSLKLYYVASDGTTRTFPEGNYEQAELHDFTVNKTRMGTAPTITATLEYPVCLDDEWEANCHFDDVYVVFNNERYYLKAKPSSSKDNTKLFYKHELTLVHERSVLETTYMVDDNENQTENILYSNNTEYTFFGSIMDFAERINQSMYFSNVGDTCMYVWVTDHYEIVPIAERVLNNDGYYVVVDGSVTNTDEVLITFSSSTVNDALKQVFEKFGVPYYFVGKVIHFGDYEAVTETTQTFVVGGVLGAGIEEGSLVPYEYGQPNSVLNVSHNNQTKQIYNRCSGKGSGDNIPYYYPNPTPTGTIHHETEAQIGSSLSDAAVTISDYLKFSNLGNNDALEYVASQVAQQSDVGEKVFIFNGAVVPFYAGEEGLGPAVYPVPMPFTYNYREDPMTGDNPHYYLLPTPASITIRVDLQKPFNRLEFDFSSFLNGVNVEWDFRSRDGGLIARGAGSAFEYDSIPLRVGTYELSFTKMIQPPTNQSLSPSQLEELMFTEIDLYLLTSDASYWTGMFGEEQYYWSLRSTGAMVNLSNYGVEVASGITLVDGDLIMKIIDKWVPPQDKLMPSCYRISDGKKRFYPARNYPLYDTPDYDPDLGDDDSIGDYINNDNYKDESDQYYHFDNEYRRLKQKEHIYDFPEIKPSIEGMTNVWNVRADMFEQFAYDLNDDNSGYFDENGNWVYNHPYFFAMLRPLGFNLFEHAIDEANMTIAMTSGHCAPCEFEIAVDKDTHKNLVQSHPDMILLRDENGDVLCGRHGQIAVYPQDFQQDTTNEPVWIALKKDTSTYGENNVMPFYDGNVEIRPKSCTSALLDDGDTFVILHIEMPQSYVESAEERLTKAIIKQMNADNSEKFNFSLKYSRVYLGDNQGLIDILNENVKVYSKYNGVAKQFFVSSYSYNIKESSPIPEITISGLVETVEELKMMATGSKGFVNSVASQISENFEELMMGINKPFTRIINQNNINVTNQVKGDFPTDYVMTKDDLAKYSVIFGNGGRNVTRLLPGETGQMLTMMNGVPIWMDVFLRKYSETLLNDYGVTQSYTSISELELTIDKAGVYLVFAQLQFVSSAQDKIYSILTTNNGVSSSSSGAFELSKGNGQLNLIGIVSIASNTTIKVFVKSLNPKTTTVVPTIDNYNKATLLVAIKIGEDAR